ncbi:MAG: ABC transporter permease subunit [Defluviitaleaceae bacterium]|nr:ABC transporter permease subunit [Defluviitaleaceae bacterium]
MGSIATGKKFATRATRPWYIRMVKQWDLQLLVVPAIIYVIIFNYIPMYGIIIAFQDFRLGDTLGFSRWVGLEHFRALLADPNLTRILTNNVVMGLLRIFIGFPLPIIFAVMLNELRSIRFKKFTQTVSYLPHFISWAVAATLMFDFFHVDGGAVNELLMWLGIIESPIFFFGESRLFWGMFIGTHVWKQLGWDAIIFVAAITAIDTELYEAASIDGASRLAKIWYITIAGIKPTIIILFILTVGSLMATSFDQIMMLTRMMGNALLREHADILSTYTFRVGISGMRFSFASAVGLLTAALNFILLISANWIARRKSDTSLF